MNSTTISALCAVAEVLTCARTVDVTSFLHHGRKLVRITTWSMEDGEMEMVFRSDNDVVALSDALYVLQRDKIWDWRYGNYGDALANMTDRVRKELDEASNE